MESYFFFFVYSSFQTVCTLRNEQKNWFLISCKNSNCLWNKVMSLALIQPDLLSCSFSWDFYIFAEVKSQSNSERKKEKLKKKKSRCVDSFEGMPSQKTYNCTVLTFITIFMSSSLQCTISCFSTYLSIGSVRSLSYTVANGTPKTRSIMCT